jgi:hypothetical protein
MSADSLAGSVPGSTDRTPMADVESNPGAGGGEPPLYKDPDNGSQRFLLELEFVQCLANPTYITVLYCPPFSCFISPR